MAVKRSHQDIMYEVLFNADAPSSLTAIMLSTALTYPQIKRYLKAALDNGMINEVPLENHKTHGIGYVATDKGKEYMAHYDALERIWDHDK